MRLPISPKMLFRLHRKFFMLRRPGTLARRGYSLTFVPGKKAPTLSLHVEKKHTPSFAIFAIISMIVTAWFVLEKK